MADETDNTQATETAGATETGTETKGVDTLLTRDLTTTTEQETEETSETGTEEKAEGKQEEKPDPLAVVPEKPEGYQLAFDKSIQVDNALQSQFCNTAHELGLNQGQAQKLAELYAGHIAKSQAESQKQLAETVSSWEQTIKSSPDFKNNIGFAQKALAQYGSPELIETLNQTYLGSHPAIFNFISKIGKELAEPSFQRGEAGGQGKTAEEVMYPNSK
ncbi:hypothetical protein [Desulfovibrio litoralis]|uniref:Peptidase n=1 Tax=Desulfovibrio litoralis DSM 11393 TaxID=1121455 RepID=A0A1M7T841_9BACT|nr:hypothetical protein [Desulfovibrio litoralis]SHN66832.1 hypothetical protein SAMN02745728_01698 [Desulfovibrio litoralis DSM 11393]